MNGAEVVIISRASANGSIAARQIEEALDNQKISYLNKDDFDDILGLFDTKQLHNNNPSIDKQKAFRWLTWIEPKFVNDLPGSRQ